MKVIAKANISGSLTDKKSCVAHVPCHLNGKRIFGAVFVALFLLTGVAGAYSGGDGTAGSPYQIRDSADLITLSTDSGNWGQNFILTADIDIPDGESPTSTIGILGTTFTGSFDGQGHTIRNFEMDKPGGEYVGLFGSLGNGGEIKKLGIEAGASGVFGDSYVGVLVGYNDGGSITNCYATGDARAGGNYAGGLVGYIDGGSIANCYATGDTDAVGYAGGLVGDNSGSITNCYATGNVTATGNYAGGLVGYNDGGSITNCYATGDTYAGSYAGGLVGSNDRGSITNCYATGDADTATGNYASGLVGFNWLGSITNCYCYAVDINSQVTRISDLSKFRDYNFITGTTENNGLRWSTDIISTEPDFSRVWYVPSSKTEYPTFQWEITGELRITSTPSGGWIWIDGVNRSVQTYASVSGISPDVNHNVTVKLDGYHAGINELVNVPKSGTTDVFFALVHETGDMQINSAPAGAIIYLNGAVRGVTNTTLSDLDTGTYNVTVEHAGLGSLSRDVTLPAGETKEVLFVFPHFSGGKGTADSPYWINTSADIEELVAISGAWRGMHFSVGSDITLIAGQPSAPIGNSAIPFTGNFDGRDHTISNLMLIESGVDAVGFFGQAGSGAVITNVSVETTEDGVRGNNHVGVLVGQNDAGSTLTGCHAAGTVVGVMNNGGLVGYNLGDIANSSATTGVTGTDKHTGGLVGQNCGSISGSYAIGDVYAPNYANGGLVGWNNDGDIVNCYATGNARGDIDDVGGLVGMNENGGTIVNCYATGDATAANVHAGGLAGMNRNSATITNSYATGTAVAVNGNDGGFLGCNAAASFTNCYRHTNGNSGLGTLITDTTQFRDYAFLTGAEGNGLAWSSGIISTSPDNAKIWRVFEYKSEYPVFQWQSVQTGMIQVVSVPDNGTIYLNGVTNGVVTNHTFTGQPVGEYNVTVVKDGYDTETEIVTLSNVTTERVNFTLVQQFGNLRINSTPSNASIYLNNVATGVSTNFTFTNKPVGVYNVTVERVGYTSSPEYQEVTLARGQTESLEFTLTQLYSGGKGTADSPYEISNIDDLMNLSTDSGNWGQNFTVTADIDLPDDGRLTSTIGNHGTWFTGSFDGQGHTIRNFEMDKPDDDYVGLFGYLKGGEIKKLGIEAGASGVCGLNIVGVLVAYNDGGSITNCYATGDAHAQYSCSGGLVGDNDDGSITNCFATGNAYAKYASGSGGLIGYNDGSITNCFATGDAYAVYNPVGGLVGYNDDGSITNCYRYADYGDDKVTRISDLSKFRDYGFLTGTTENNGLRWSTDIISTEPDSSRVWYVSSSKTEYPTFQRVVPDPGTPPINITPDSKPVPSFTATPVSGDAPLPVTFTDTSAGDPQSWNWSFGDGSVSDVQHPVHIYERAGTYSVSLTATNVYGSVTCEKEQFITANYHHESDGDDNPTPYIKPTPTPALTPVPTTITPTPVPKPAILTGTTKLPVSPNGEVEKRVTLWAEGMSGYLTIDAGVVARDASGHLVGTVSIVAVPAITIPSSGKIGAIEHPRALYVFNCTPEGATFSPAINLTFTLSEDEWNLFGNETEVGWFNSTSKEWEVIAGVADPGERTITIPVSHFSMYALFTDDVPEVPLPDMTKIPPGESGSTPIWVWGGLIIVVGILGGIIRIMRKRE